MKNPRYLRDEALVLRRKGHSLKELSDLLNVSKSTASLWVRGIILDADAQKRLDTLSILAKKRADKRWGQYRITRDLEIENYSKKTIISWKQTQENSQILAALLFWAEGSKDLGNIAFMNSDPLMVRTFLKLLRKGFKLDEAKFRVLLHLHEYHLETEMIDYWSRITQIPVSQFSKTFIKQHTMKRIHPDYRGCCKVKYYDTRIARILSSIYNNLAKVIGP